MFFDIIFLIIIKEAAKAYFRRKNYFLFLGISITTTPIMAGR